MTKRSRLIEKKLMVPRASGRGRDGKEFGIDIHVLLWSPVSVKSLSRVSLSAIPWTAVFYIVNSNYLPIEINKMDNKEGPIV